MKKRSVLVVGLLGVLLVFGAAVALAQNASEKTKDNENHECTPEMMENMPENCPDQMMQSGDCENMMNGAKGCGEMMGNSNNVPVESNTNTEKENHCGDMGSGMDSTMTKPMM